MVNTRCMETVEVMKSKGYFRTETEYTKAKNWAIKGIIPEWLKKEMTKYKGKRGTNANTSNNKNG